MASLREELKLQKEIVSTLLTRIYGVKSEKMSSDQMLLAFLEEDAKKPEAADPEDQGPAAKQTTKKKRAKRTNKLIDSLEGLPTNERIITDPEVLANPELFRLLGEEITIRLHASAATFTREIIKRQTHVRKSDPDAIPITPPLQPCLLPGSILTPSLGALLLTEKFCYHQPFYRQEWRLRATHGIDLTRNNMCNWHNHLADRLLPLYQLIADKLRQSSYLKADETPIACLEPGKGKTATGYFWAYHHPIHGPLFDWHKSRANTCLDNILLRQGYGGQVLVDESFTGYLQSDGLRAYRTFRERYPDLDIIAVSCLAHIRRKFWEARKDHPEITTWILLQIGKIYDIERKLKKQNATALERQRTRWLETRLHYDRLRRLIHHLHEKTSSILPQSNLGKALSYALDQWDHLEPCFLDGQIEFDNNHTEGAIRPTKLGAKNWMFIGGEETGWRSAVIYTFIEQIRRHQMDPHAYLEWVFEKLMHNPGEDELESLLPENWVAAQRSTVNLQTSAA